MASEDNITPEDQPVSNDLPTTALPKLPSLEITNDQDTNPQKVTQTPIDSPESENFSFDDDFGDDRAEEDFEIIEKTAPSIEEKPKVRPSEMEETKVQEYPFDEDGNFAGWSFENFWYWRNQEILRIAIARLVATRNQLNRQNGLGEAMLWTSIFTPSTYPQDSAELYHLYNEISTDVLDHCDKNELRYWEKRFGPQLPLGFRDAGAEERLILSQKKFAELMDAPSAENPWKTLDIKNIIYGIEGETCDIYRDLRRRIEYEDEFIGPFCFHRTGHFCRRGVCAPRSDVFSTRALRHFEDARGYAKKGEMSLLVKNQMFDAIQDIEHLQESVELGLIFLNDHMGSCRRYEEDHAKRMRNILDGLLKGEDVKGFMAPIMLPDENTERPWPARVTHYIRHSYTTRKFLYDLNILLMATPFREKLTFPADLLQSWGYEMPQRKASDIFVKQLEAARRSEQLFRAGWAPPFLAEVAIPWWIVYARELDFERSYYQHTPQGNRPLHRAVAAQVINYLCFHLFWYAKIQKNSRIEPTDPSWEWCVKVSPRVEPVRHWNDTWYEPPTPCTQMYNEYQREATLEPVLEHYMPPGFKRATTADERIRLTESWIQNIIKPTAAYFFSKQGWKMSDDEIEAKIRADFVGLPEDEVQEKIQAGLREEVAREKLLSCSTIMRNTSSTKERLAQIPAGLLNRTDSTSASKYMAREEVKIHVLADHGIDFLLQAEKTHGTGAFRTVRSPAIMWAAAKAVAEKGGVLMVPFQGSLLCDCRSKRHHLTLLVERVARAMCEKLDDRDNAGRNEAENLMEKDIGEMLGDILKSEMDGVKDEECMAKDNGREGREGRLSF